MDSVGTGNSHAKRMKCEAYALDLAALLDQVDVWVGKSSRGTQRVVPVDMWKVQILNSLETLFLGESCQKFGYPRGDFDLLIAIVFQRHLVGSLEHVNNNFTSHLVVGQGQIR